MMSVYAANDKVAAEWFAPAGLNRGGIPTAVSVADRLTHTERDTLYEGHVNPIAAFPGQGVVAWGQKTLQRNPSALDRVNVRRLLIDAEEVHRFFKPLPSVRTKRGNNSPTFLEHCQPILGKRTTTLWYLCLQGSNG